jgi:hypothetical protein
VTDSRRVYVHVHLAVTGAFPLRVADVLFADDAVIVPEYEYLTPLFGILRGRTAEAGAAARRRYREDGLRGLLAAAERTHRIRYEDVTRVRVYHGGRVGRPKIAVDVREGPPYAYRIHTPTDVDALAAALDAHGERRGFAVSVSSGLGFAPGQSLRRFLSDR